MYESSAKDGKELTTLDEYISRMPADQKDIYYLNISSRDLAESSPYYEVFKKRHLEVLFLYNPVDDFVMTNVREYKGKKFVSVENAEIDLSAEDKKEEEAKAMQAQGRSLGRASRRARLLDEDLARREGEGREDHPPSGGVARHRHRQQQRRLPPHGQDDAGRCAET